MLVYKGGPVPPLFLCTGVFVGRMAEVNKVSGLISGRKVTGQRNNAYVISRTPFTGEQVGPGHVPEPLLLAPRGITYRLDRMTTGTEGFTAHAEDIFCLTPFVSMKGFFFE